MSASSAETPLEALVGAVRGCRSTPADVAPPVAILWTDPARQWAPLAPRLRQELPELLVLGDYDPDRRTGPAVWLRCLVDRTLDDPPLPADRPPILLLPGVGRQQLKAGEECPAEFQPLVELMYRGTLWLQRGGRDWTVFAFLTSQDALELDLARDDATRDALLRALQEVFETPLAQLRGRRLEADDFDRLLSPDVKRDVLRWMADPEATRARLNDNGWEALCSRCRDELGFDPSTEQDVVAGEHLAAREGPWEAVWERFVQAPSSYPGIVDLLRRSRPSQTLPFDRSPWPDLNDEAEISLRKALDKVTGLSHAEACQLVEDLEQQHAERRDWVWADLGYAPLARVLEPLATLAAGARTPLAGSTPDDLRRAYTETAWTVDAAAWEALALCNTQDEGLIGDVVHHLLAEWLDDSARAFQRVAQSGGLPEPREQARIEADEDGVVLFADGLRYDLGVRLTERLEARQCRVRLGSRWSALPTVTATGKPAASPAAEAIAGNALGEDFAPELQPSGKPVNARNLREHLRDSGYQILGEGTFDTPLEAGARGWDEFGQIDALGHKLGGRLPRSLEEELDRLAERVIGLLDAGWTSVRVVTDHGWLLLPRGLPKVQLPKHLTASRWARCAVLAGQSTPDVPRYTWTWNSAYWFAAPPGAACFNTSEAYAHGGLSVQECLVPDLVVQREGETHPRASITEISWRRMRCNVQVSGAVPGLRIDLRLGSVSGASVAATTKDVPEDGAASIILESDEHESADLVVVLLDTEGRVVSYQSTRTGEAS